MKFRSVLLSSAFIVASVFADAYPWRGLMLDEGRFFFGKQVVKETLDRMAACGLNVFHWHLTEDQGWRLEIRQFPELTQIGAVRPGSAKVHTENVSDGKTYGPFYYTQDDVREILQYAAERNITVVPEIELPGHVKALLAAHPEFSCTGKVEPKDLIPMGVQEDVLCAGNDAAIRFLEQVFDEVCDLFPSEVIHIGGDECPKKRWKACPKCQARIKSLGLKDEKDLQAWVTHHFANYLAAKGRRAMGWDEILEGEGCPTNVIVQSWRTVSSHKREGVSEAPAIAAARRGFDVVVSPVDRTYFSIPMGPDDPGEYRRPVSKYGSYITPESVKAFRPDAGFPEDLKKHILGAECCCWSEGTRTGPILHHKTWPRAAIFAETLGPSRSERGPLVNPSHNPGVPLAPRRDIRPQMGTPDESSLVIGTQSSAASSSEGRLVLPILPDEYWWGGEVLEGRNQPFSAASKDYAVDMHLRHGTSGGNQAAPVLLSSKGRWVWCEQAFRYSVVDGTLVVEPEAKRSAPKAEPLPAKVLTGTAGTTLRDAYLYCSKTFFPPKGHPQLKFFAEPIINTWISLKYNQNEKEILEIAEEFKRHGVRPGVYMIDHTWHGDRLGDWDFTPARFHDPKGMVAKMKAMGYSVMLWFDPHITTDGPVYRLLNRDGMLLRNKSGRAADSYWWAGKSAILDCTNPKTYQWLKDTCDRLMRDYGVEGFFFDAGDAYNYDPDAVPFDQVSTPSDQVRAFHLIGLDVPYQQHRASWKMGGLPLMQTLRDKHPTYPELLACIRDGLEAGLLGYPFVTFDMVGGGTVSSFEGEGYKAAQEHFVRSMQVHTLSPMIQFSLVPWRVLDAEHAAVIDAMVKLRQEWSPYIVQCAVDCGQTGEPMMRAMEYAYPGHGYEQVMDQFLMGDKLLVAPQVYEGATTRKVVIPPGTWKADDGTAITGPTTIEVATPLARLPYFVRQ